MKQYNGNVALPPPAAGDRNNCYYCEYDLLSVRFSQPLLSVSFSCNHLSIQITHHATKTPGDMIVEHKIKQIFPFLRQ